MISVTGEQFLVPFLRQTYLTLVKTQHGWLLFLTHGAVMSSNVEKVCGVLQYAASQLKQHISSTFAVRQILSSDCIPSLMMLSVCSV